MLALARTPPGGVPTFDAKPCWRNKIRLKKNSLERGRRIYLGPPGQARVPRMPCSKTVFLGPNCHSAHFRQPSFSFAEEIYRAGFLNVLVADLAATFGAMRPIAVNPLATFRPPAYRGQISRLFLGARFSFARRDRLITSDDFRHGVFATSCDAG